LGRALCGPTGRRGKGRAARSAARPRGGRTTRRSGEPGWAARCAARPAGAEKVARREVPRGRAGLFQRRRGGAGFSAPAQAGAVFQVWREQRGAGVFFHDKPLGVFMGARYSFVFRRETDFRLKLVFLFSVGNWKLV